MEDHFECMWDMYRSVPSLRIPGASYLDEYYWLDKEDPNSSNCRLIHKRGNELPTDGLYQLGSHASEIVKLVLTPESEIQGKQLKNGFHLNSLKLISGLIGQQCLLLKNGTLLQK
jgi:oleate hydratase